MNTLIELLDYCVENYADTPILLEKKTDRFEPTTYKQAAAQVHQMAKGLFALGLKKGDRVALLSEGRNDWLISELAILSCGAINVPLSVKLDAEVELLFRIRHSGARMVIVSKGQLPKIRLIEKHLAKNVETILVLDEITDCGPKEITKATVLQKGEQLSAYQEKEVYEAAHAIQGNDVANISYTSGTTADPKGIILSHRNYMANVEQSASLMSIPQSHRTLAILPWDHAFAHTACLYSFMYYGGTIASIQIGSTPMETLKNIPINIKEVKPHMLMSVPALAKNFKKNIESGIRAKGPTAVKLFNHALKVAYKYNKLGYNKGSGGTFIYKPLLLLYDKILFSKVREGFGGCLEQFIGGGALLDLELQKFFYAIGIPMLQGYGLSEASPVISANSLKKHKLGSSGFLVDNMELKILDADGRELPQGEKGEIVIKGENVMQGYWQNEAATQETLKNGWLHTGDMGYMDKDGFLYVLGRFKSLLIASDGEKYSPEGIEEALVDQSQVIEQAMLHNNQNPYTLGLIVPSKSYLLRQLAEARLQPDSDEGIAFAIQRVQQEMNRYKSGGEFEGMFPGRWLPATFCILPETFNEANKLLNTTLKMVRGKIEERFSDEIAYGFTPEARDVTNSLNKRNMFHLLNS